MWGQCTAAVSRHACFRRLGGEREVLRNRHATECTPPLRHCSVPGLTCPWITDHQTHVCDTIALLQQCLSWVMGQLLTLHLYFNLSYRCIRRAFAQGGAKPEHPKCDCTSFKANTYLDLCIGPDNVLRFHVIIRADHGLCALYGLPAHHV
jgi:hypothetical protein